LRLVTRRRRDHAQARRPVRQGRAPLRRAGAAGHHREPFPVVPSAKDGLHCGSETELAGLHVTMRRPVRQGRAPLRRPGHVFEPAVRQQSSRPPRTGSIAATCGRSARACAPSRPVRQGRAPLRPHPGRQPLRAHRRRPVRQGRAPLRHGTLAQGPHQCPGRPVRQGRAPLRRAARPPGLANPDSVVPSAKDGLHCGWWAAPYRARR